MKIYMLCLFTTWVDHKKKEEEQTDRQKYKHRKNQHYNYIQTATKYVQHKLHKTLSKQSHN